MNGVKILFRKFITAFGRVSKSKGKILLKSHVLIHFDSVLNHGCVAL